MIELRWSKTVRTLVLEFRLLLKMEKLSKQRLKTQLSLKSPRSKTCLQWTLARKSSLLDKALLPRLC